VIWYICLILVVLIVGIWIAFYSFDVPDIVDDDYVDQCPLYGHSCSFTCVDCPELFNKK